MTKAHSTICINEVVLRDGLQNEPHFLATDDKIKLADALSETGIARLEVTSFVSPKAIPNLADAAEVMKGITRKRDVIYSVLVPNEKGCERALLVGVDEINLVMSVGEQHNLANMRMTCAQSLEQFARIMPMVRGTDVKVNGTLATTFGCPFGGKQPEARVFALIEQYLALGFDSITLADTVGMACPTEVYDLVRNVIQAYPDVPLTLHFHNTRGMGLANVTAAYQAGARSFDAALGGIGGCPYAPGATGNICTEDTVHMLAECGYTTGVDVTKLIKLSNTLPELLGHDVPGLVAKAGPSDTIYHVGYCTQ